MVGYRVRAYSMLRDLYPYIINDLKNPITCKAKVKEFNSVHQTHLSVTHGMCRIVIVAENDFVIKVDYGHLQDLQRYGNCETEFHMYKKAKDQHYEYLFAEVTRVLYKNRYWYIMPYIDDVGRYDDGVLEYLDGEDYDFIADNVSDVHEDNYGWKDGYPVIIDYADNCYTGNIDFYE